VNWILDVDIALLRLFNLGLTIAAQRGDEHHDSQGSHQQDQAVPHS